MKKKAIIKILEIVKLTKRELLKVKGKGEAGSTEDDIGWPGEQGNP